MNGDRFQGPFQDDHISILNFRETCRPRATPARLPALAVAANNPREMLAVSCSVDCGGANQWGLSFGPGLKLEHDLFAFHMATRVSRPGLFHYSINHWPH